MTKDAPPDIVDGSEGVAHVPAAGRSQVSLLVSGLLCVLPLAALSCLMAANRNFQLSVPFGFLCCLGAAYGILDLFQCFGAPAKGSSLSLAPQCLLRRAALAGLASVAQVATLYLGVQGNLPYAAPVSALLIPASFMLLVISYLGLAQALGLTHSDQPLVRRHGFWLMLLHALVYLPLLGSYSLIDPWETHYGEVAREMLARDDWISLWWAQDGWFWSKPVLDFWLQGLSFSLLGVQYLPDQMIASVASGNQPHPEWAARMPVFLMAAVANYLLYKAVSRAVHPRAGFLAAIVLLTMPYWALLAHQSMTDMPYVAPMVAGLSLFVLGLTKSENAELQSYQVTLGRRKFHFNLTHLFLAGVLLSTLPQVCYLLSRNLTLDVASGALSLHADEFMAGSGGYNCGLPGNAACRPLGPKSVAWQPALLSLLWLFLSLTFVKQHARLVSARALCFVAAWFSIALSFMAKGAPGLVLPLFVMAVFLAASKRWSTLLELRPSTLLLLFGVLVLPWYVQMVMRHGSGFIERLLLHDMYKRAFSHVHDTNDGVDVSFRYYIWQLGYGLFPWSGVAVAGLLRWASLRNEPRRARFSATDLSNFAGLWFVAAFGLFTISGTKFHHYILPAVPPLAILAGLWLHEVLGTRQVHRHLGYALGLGASVGTLLVGIVLWHPSPLGGVRASETASPTAATASQPILGGFLILVAAIVLLTTLRVTRHLRTSEPDSPATTSTPMLALVAAVGTWLVGRDFLKSFGEQLPGEVLLMHLFTYQYKRTWPEHLDVAGPLFAVLLLATLLTAALASSKARVHTSYLLVATAVAFCAWVLNLYLPRAAPHWGQRETIAAYYRSRETRDVPLIAFQMNWKGENWYTGNRVAAFVRSGKPFQEWMAALRERNHKILYFTTEPSRMNALKRELKDYRKFEILTTPRDNARFAIARVEL